MGFGIPEPILLFRCVFSVFGQENIFVFVVKNIIRPVELRLYLEVGVGFGVLCVLFIEAYAILAQHIGIPKHDLIAIVSRLWHFAAIDLFVSALYVLAHCR